MCPATDRQIERALFDAALNLPDPEVRQAFLDRTCREDSALRSRLEILLQAHEDAERFLDADPLRLLSRLAGEQKPERAGVRLDGPLSLEGANALIGRYRLLRRLGEGGWGVVYEAEQLEPVKRRVALKVIRLGMDTERVIARFGLERQALAMMDHANIARVLDAGATESGRPYFVMELVSGVKITDFCDANRQGIEKRLELFVPVCLAIQHAHQKGILHRDIKPSNVLVTLQDGVPVPKVIDFGIAKAVEGRLGAETSVSLHEQFIGTPAYMSPEQVETGGLDVDTRSDIYSLGALLYELLSGRPPFDTKQLLESGVDKMRRVLQERDPLLPSGVLGSLNTTEQRAVASHFDSEGARLVSSLRGDLDSIVMKAMAKDRRRRYATVNGLALDIQRCLNHEPVSARPPERIYRFRKFVRRNKTIFAAATMVLLTLAAGLGVSSWLFLMEREARHQQAHLREAAESAERKEAAARQQAEDREKIIQAAIFVSQQKLTEADQLLDELKSHPSRPSLDGVSAFRWVAEWLACRGRWEKASERFSSLLQMNELDTWDMVTADYLSCGVLLARIGDEERYEKFRKATLEHFSATKDWRTNERVLRISLLMPTSQADLDQLAPLARYAEAACESGKGGMGRMMLSLALWKYRVGDYHDSEKWIERALASDEAGKPTFEVTARLVLAMNKYRLGQPADAHLLVEEGKAAIQNRLKLGLERGTSQTGYWFDWIFAQVLLQEASTGK